MKIKAKTTPRFAFLIAMLTLLSCAPGYEKEGEKWVWVSYDEAVGKRITPIDAHDAETFEVLENSEYARDKNSVFFVGQIIKNADPQSFELLENGYAKDRDNVFLDTETVIFADPATFVQLEFPYSKDARHVFCGTIPLMLDEGDVQEFRVTNEDKLMSHLKSTSDLSYFLEFNPQYQWLDTLGIETVILGESATGETAGRKFKGVTEVE